MARRHEDLLVTTCSSHHAQAHEGRLLIEGTVSTGLVFKHADGSPYGGNVVPETAGVLSEAFEALVALGFKQGEAKRALDEVRAHVGAGGAIDSPVDALKIALRWLRSGRDG